MKDELLRLADSWECGSGSPAWLAARKECAAELRELQARCEALEGELAGWRRLLQAVVTQGMPASMAGLVVPLWPNDDWTQEQAMVAYALHLAQQRAITAEAQVAALRGRVEGLAAHLDAYRKAINKIDDLSEYRQISRAQITSVLAALTAALAPSQAIGGGE